MTKPISKPNKLLARRQLFINRISEVYNLANSEVENLFSTNRKQAAWLTVNENIKDYSWLPLPNTDKADSSEIKKLSKEYKAYIQNASSWIPVIALDPNPGDTMLDVCAAPGGKSLLSSYLANKEINITANDVSRARIIKMEKLFNNFDINIKTINFRAESLARVIEKQKYNKILVDAPCSGEGMINLGQINSLEQWSTANIKRLSQQTRKILHSAWQLLEPGGVLVFSTCTVAPEENELAIEKFLKSHEDAELIDIMLPENIPTIPIVNSWGGTAISETVKLKTKRIKHSLNFEAFYVAKLRKTA